MTIPFENNKEQRRRKSFMRLGALLAFLVSCVLLVKYTVIGTWISLENMQYMVEKTGFWGVLIFIALFVISAILNIPGTVFLLLAVLLFGYWQGALFSYIGALLGAWATFIIGRKVGGTALSEITNPMVRNLLAQVETRPIRTIIVLRVLVQLAPIVGYLLALTNIKERQYIAGNLIGISIPIVVLTLGMYFFEDSIRYLFG